MPCGFRDKTRVLHKQTRCTTYPHTLSLTLSLTLSTQPRTLLAVSNLSVTVCLLGLSVIICRLQEQIISETPCPHFGDVMFNIWCYKTVVAWDRSPPPTICWRRLQSVPGMSYIELDICAPALSSKRCEHVCVFHKDSSISDPVKWLKVRARVLLASFSW